MFQVIVIVGDSRICRYVTCCSRDVSSSAIHAVPQLKQSINQSINPFQLFIEQHIIREMNTDPHSTRVWSHSSDNAARKRQNVTTDEKTPLLSAEWTRDHSSCGRGSEGRGSQARGGGKPDAEGGRGHRGGGGSGGRCGGELALGWTLVKAFFWSAVASNVWKLPHDLLLLANPLLLG